MAIRDSFTAAAKALVSRYPDFFRPVWRVLFPLMRTGSRYAGTEYGDRAEAFEIIYRENRWRDGESISGPGSTLRHTRQMQASLARAVGDTGARSMLDAPCGDFNWMQHIELPEIELYTGGEIVADLARGLQDRFGSERRRFVQLDIVSDPLPDCDLWLCRHVLFHLSNDDVLALLANFARSNVGFLLADMFTFVKTNEDIRSGGFRFINLLEKPFNLPAPMKRYAHADPPDAPDYLCLWSRQQVAEALNDR